MIYNGDKDNNNNNNNNNNRPPKGDPTSKTLKVRDKYLYTATNKCLQCLIKLMYIVF